MVDAVAVGGVGGAAESEVPFEEVGFEGCSVVIGGRIGGEFCGFAHCR